MTLVPSLPLLGKELVELAARRRTYVVRVVYAVLLFGLFALVFYNYTRYGSGIYGMLGRGGLMFESMILFQFCGIFIFLPALMSGSITYEKERDSLALLFLTDLGPGEIVAQKFIAGLVPMLSFLLLSMPLAAMAYAFGGVSPERLVMSFAGLLVTCLQVGAFALLCSAFFRTTAAAFLGSYLLGAAFYMGVPLAMQWAYNLSVEYRYIDQRTLFALFPPIALSNSWNDSRTVQIFRLAPILASAGVFLGMARYFLVRRAFLPPRNPLLAVFRWIDRVMQRANRFTGNILIGRKEAQLPGNDPVAWRELTKRSLGRVNYLVRLLLVIELPVLSICLLAAAGNDADELYVLSFILWGIAFLVLVVQAANTIVSERVNQTLDVLLTTPISGRDIVSQKWRALRRLCIVLAIPLLTVSVMRSSDSTRYSLVCAVLAVVVYLPLIAWGSLYIGLRSRTRFRAILTAMGVGVGWCLLPVLVVIVSEAVSDFEEETLLLVGPATIVFLNEIEELRIVHFLVLPVNFTLYLAALLITRWRCLASAEHYLRR